MSILIKNAHAFDPRNNVDDILDVVIDRGKVKQIGKSLDVSCDETIDATGKYLLPGFVDLHVHFREPGDEYKETIKTGAMAALRGGIVGAVAMPNTSPATDSQAIVEFVLKRASEANFNIFPCGTLSKGRAGKDISEMSELKEAGCVAVSDDGSYLSNPLVARRAFEYASSLGLIVMSHAEIPQLTVGGVMNEGETSTRLGLKGSPDIAESMAVACDIELAKLTGAHIHICHISTKKALENLVRAREQGVHATCEVTPHHFALTDTRIKNYETNLKMNPPLRTDEDKLFMIEGLKKGYIDCIATDHAPHSEEEKDREFEKAPVGVIGLETSFPVTMTELYHKEKMSLDLILEKLSLNPTKMLGLLDFNEIKEGSKANFALVDLDEKWVVAEDLFYSKSRNSSFLGKEVQGNVVATVCNGKLYQWAKELVKE